MDYDLIYLARAFELAKRGRFTTAPNPNVGCVIVSNAKIVGEGYHMCAGEPHAEICALDIAGKYASNATVYITLEPCSHYGRTPPCADALIKANVKRVVVAMLDPNPKVSGRGILRLQASGIEVRHSLMLEEAEAINKGFLKRMRTGLPWIRIKLASSLDGRTAMASGESKWITSSQARQDLQIFRAESDVILSTASTVLIDNPELNIRYDSLPRDIQSLLYCDHRKKKIRQPIRVIIDSANQITPIHRIVHGDNPTWLARLRKDDIHWPKSVEQILLPSTKHNANKIELMALFKKLGHRQINNVLVESGSNLAGNLLIHQLVDELIIYQSMKLLGNDAYPLFILPKMRQLKEALFFDLIDIRKIGPDVRLILKPRKLNLSH
ncbi:bifunctional diaminohydroxyphosphoribosylaminopyrimidine deaminase/5-amino-6-(5-phosphoribosylamino)uracil reductase RibD [Candidatus Schneideria nysicola]|uniref:bifunctional diaminohydroxyphosphoribosylaminopyrimidine deaminase/5-amino-6-(5-phosphoribosylamino)uracil reductase RibD n=1 Tax=Candidatus Schneideria nysicola TaxID=1081631 RepID=UPI001CAA785C|nr:bifunctional diaminohydroxyphosphoribosylaminopyrimidine deaminase/5-amino-6-(5-phosphoribosylamino)uracil reductase RibD [Candidatus Schneideria nysicola]UAJ65267.1 bifunctional diaminohydroxyphosphoribosylaminopyrimidine deaminase/5-amino-6-(5-phosphoribosylamino)uracil reductase RibD [Candidatus Schneideria nysicola]UAJ65742.1 bifunctional diaminohydroxyphosphoribosylaminopyrimidine deaminase/5-amino-6-(5-phosphoribosylamino)uracil reductase RibD [Candidatus Schneideria nysicola]UAJ66329.1